MTKKKTAIHIFHSPGTAIETRLYKTCKSITNLGLVNEVIALCYHEGNLGYNEKITDSFSIKRFNCFKNYLRSLNKSTLRRVLALLSYIKYLINVFIYCIFKRPHFISCHNAQLLPVCVIIKFLSGAKLIYEPHELESHKTGLSSIEKKITKIIEKITLPFCYKIICVCEPITDFYKKVYNLKDNKVFTVSNAPINPNFGSDFKRTTIFREKYNIPEDHVIFLYQGLIGESRGLNMYLNVFKKVSSKFHIIFMGYGSDIDKIKNLSKTHTNIHYHEAVPQNEIINYSSSADVGFVFLEGEISLSYKYSLPNKFFEYAIAGLKICVSDNLELLSQYVNKYQLGTTLEASEESLFTYISKYQNDPEYFKKISIESLDLRKSVGWQNEEKTFIEVYK